MSFEISPQSEVLALKPKLKELDTIYFAQKKLLSRRVKDLFSSVSSMKDEKGDNIKAKGHADVMFKEAEARGIARLEEECSKMGTHLEGATSCTYLNLYINLMYSICWAFFTVQLDTWRQPKNSFPPAYPNV